MTTNPATRPFWVVVGSGIDVRGIDVLGQIFDFSGIEKSEKSIKKTWQEFRDALSKGDFSFDDIASAKKNTFLRVYDDLAMLDYALRRRFAFFEIKPGFTTDGFREYRMSLENEKFDKLIACVESLNNVISNDESLGDGFCIGHSYFCNLLPDTIDDQVLSGIVEYELIPLLKEYWFDEPTKVKDWSSNLRSAIK